MCITWLCLMGSVNTERAHVVITTKTFTALAYRQNTGTSVNKVFK